ncbi:MAG: hypothetical protein Kow0029_22730 [Candidatus Rifleibacteriota bacterium]
MQHTEIIFRLNAMGDILLLIPTLREMQNSGIDTHLVINQRWAELAGFLPAKTHLYTGTGSMLRLAAKLKALRPAAVHDLQGKVPTIVLRMLIPANRKTAYQKRSFKEQLMAIRKAYPLFFSDQRPIWQKYAETVGVKIANPDPSLNLSRQYLKSSHEMVESLDLKPGRFILIHAEASKKAKTLPKQLLDAVIKKTRLPVALIGTTTDNWYNNEKVIDLRNRILLNQLPGFISLSAGMISSDSGPMHLARAVNVPLAAVFLQTDPCLGFSPVPGKKVLIVSRSLPCKPCSLHGQREICPEGHFACRDLPAEETADEILEFLGAVA